MPGLHAVLSASGAKRWLACPPSARLEEKLQGIFGEKSSPFAEEGTKAHELSELKLRKANGEINDFTFKAMREQLVKKFGDVPGEMERATDDYVDIVMGSSTLPSRSARTLSSSSSTDWTSPDGCPRDSAQVMLPSCRT